MSSVIVENLSKRYVLNHAPRLNTLRDTLTHGVRGWWNRLREPAARDLTHEEFWALRDVSFEVQPGDVIGIIGRNGAGKSTLLKILSRITEPTSGRARIRGRIASLLEVGTGFHPELTGRENIFLNGSILGMSRVEIRRNFDEIVAFAEIERFLDTPVKRYSSGMYVRLAFAVAAHLTPEILIVDEVLAVGDAAFQKKCLGKMEDVATHGRTVIFVSHELANVARLCRRGILLKNGRVEQQGEISEVIARYLQDDPTARGSADLRSRTDRSGSGEALFRSVQVRPAGRVEPTATVDFAAPFTFEAIIDVLRPIGSAQVSFVVTSSDGTPVFNLENRNESLDWPSASGAFRFNVTVPQNHLVPGSYAVDVWIGNQHRQRVDYVRRALAFDILPATGAHGSLYLDRRDGPIFTRSQWEWQRC